MRILGAFCAKCSQATRAKVSSDSELRLDMSSQPLNRISNSPPLSRKVITSPSSVTTFSNSDQWSMVNLTNPENRMPWRHRGQQQHSFDPRPEQSDEKV
jgi:hypothetical protein